MMEGVVAQGYLTLTADTPFGETTVQFLLDGVLYEAEALHHPAVKNGEIDTERRFLAVKVRRIGAA